MKYSLCASVLGFIILVSINHKDMKVIKLITIGLLIGYTTALIHRNSFTSGVVTYVGNDIVFIENSGLYSIDSSKYQLSIGDKISFSRFGNKIQRIHSKTQGKPLMPFIIQHREHIKSLLRKNKYFGFWLAILIGDKSYVQYDNIKNLMNSNIYHLIVISGFHLSFIYYLVYNIVYKITQRSITINHYCTLYASYDIIPHSLACIAILYYFQISLFGLPSIRAIAMILLKKTKFSSKTILLSMMIASILYSPNIIFNKGFILSYVVTLLILEKQSNTKVAIFTSTITNNINPFTLFNNLIGTTILYVLLPAGFIAIIINNVSILNIFNKLIEILIHHLPTISINTFSASPLVSEIIALLTMIYLQEMKSIYIYSVFLLYIISNIIH